MADMRAALAARLLQAPGVSTIVGTRVDWLRRPQAAALPSITLQTITDARPRHLKGYQGARETRVQIDCWATSYAASVSAASAVVAIVEAPGVFGGVRFGGAAIEGQRDFVEDRDGETDLYRQSIDVTFWHEGE